MARSRDRSVLAGYITEVRDSLAAIRIALADGRSEARRADALYDAFRLTHSIKGGAALVGLAALSQILDRQEEVLEALVEERVAFDAAAERFFEQTLAAVEEYMKAVTTGAPDDTALVTGVVTAYHRYMQVSESEDAREIAKVVALAAADPAANAAQTPTSTSSATKPATKSTAQSSDEGDAAALFQSEADEHLGTISRLLTTLGESPQETAQTLEEVRRHVHSLKGSAGAGGFRDVARLAHHMESLIEQSAESGVTPELAPLLLQTTDVLEDLVAGTKDRQPLEDLLRQYAALTGDAEGPAFDPQSPKPAVRLAPVEDFSWIALDELQQISPELMTVYREEAEDHLKRMYEALRQLEHAPQDRNLIQEVRRPAHTLKGAAGAVGVQVVTKLAHRMEDLLDQLFAGQRELTGDMLKLLFATTDTLTELSEGRFDPAATREAIIAQYRKYGELLGDAADAAPATSEAEDLGSEPIEIEAPLLAATNESTPSNQRNAPAAKQYSPDQVLRVPIERLDELVRVVSELIINRTAFEQRMQSFGRFVEELQTTIDRLRQVSHEVETRYGVNALGAHPFLGGGIAGGGIAGDGASTPGGSSLGKHTSGGGLQITRARFEEFDSLEFDRYTNFHLVSRSLAETTADISTLSSEFRNLIGDFDTLLNRQGRLSRDTQDRLMRIRMVPLATLTTRLHRIVRNVAVQQTKEIDLIVDGEQIELDKNVLEEMVDPLMHLLRNAADHGIEPPALRVATGKPRRATIRLQACYQGTQVVLRVTDDGQGIDAERVRRKAIENGLVAAADAEAMSVDELHQLIFVPGFSTAHEVSEVSGRGVGMDVVRHTVQKLKGTIHIESKPGQGTTFTIRLPMTLAVTRALLVTTGNATFAIPAQAVTQILRLERTAIERLGHERVIRVNGRVFPVVQLSERLGMNITADDTSRTVPVLIVSAGDQQIAVCVDRVLGGRDIVVKTLGTHLRRVKGVIGATLMGDGSVVPIVDPAELAEQFTSTTTVAPTARVVAPRREAPSDALTVMIVDDSVSVRRVMTNLVKKAGWNAIVAKDGVDALEILHSAAQVPDVFLLDIEMPRMDGYELLGALRSQAAYRTAPIVMVTSRAGAKHREKALALGASDYVVKPYQDDALLAIVRRLAAQRRAAAASLS